jgi:cytochrome P450
MRTGRPVLFLYPSANRDPREFERPDEFDIDRRPPRILSFGHGIHACIGQHFARLEGRLCLEKVLRHMPEYEVQEDRLRRIRTEFVQGWESMPVRWRRAA